MMFDNWCWAQWFVLIYMMVEIIAGVGKTVLDSIIERNKDGSTLIFGASVIHIIMNVIIVYALHVGGFW